MRASRQKPENHWKGVGAAVARRGGSQADLDRVMTTSRTVNAWIAEGYAAANRREANRLVREKLAEARGAIRLHRNAIPGSSVLLAEIDAALKS